MSFAFLCFLSAIVPKIGPRCTLFLDAGHPQQAPISPAILLVPALLAVEIKLSSHRARTSRYTKSNACCSVVSTLFPTLFLSKCLHMIKRSGSQLGDEGGVRNDHPVYLGCASIEWISGNCTHNKLYPCSRVYLDYSRICIWRLGSFVWSATFRIGPGARCWNHKEIVEALSTLCPFGFLDIHSVHQIARFNTISCWSCKSLIILFSKKLWKRNVIFLSR